MPTLETDVPLSGEVLAESLNQEFELLTPEERIERTVELFVGRVVVASKCGRTSPVLLEKVRSTAPDTKIVSIRTHHEPLERAGVICEYGKRSDLNFQIYDSEPIPIPLPLQNSPPDDPELIAFHRQLKIETFQDMLKDLRPVAYLSGAMRWEYGRQDMPIVKYQGSVLAIRPVADVSQAEVEALLEETYLPYPRNDFDPAKGLDQKLECGLNTVTYPEGA